MKTKDFSVLTEGEVSLPLDELLGRLSRSVVERVVRPAKDECGRAVRVADPRQDGVLRLFHQLHFHRFETATANAR